MATDRILWIRLEPHGHVEPAIADRPADPLVSRGFDYLSDDAVPLSEPDDVIVPWPLPLSIKPGSVELLRSRFPELGNAPVYSTKGTEARLLFPRPKRGTQRQ